MLDHILLSSNVATTGVARTWGQTLLELLSLVGVLEDEGVELL